MVYFWRAVRWVQELDAQGVTFLSDEFGARCRKKAEEIVLGWAEGQDKGIRRLFWSDNALLRVCGIGLKSDAILRVCTAKPSQKAAARERLRVKNPAESVARWNWEAADRHGNHP